MVGAISEMALEAMDMGDGTHRTGSLAQNKGKATGNRPVTLSESRHGSGLARQNCATVWTFTFKCQTGVGTSKSRIFSGHGGL